MVDATLVRKMAHAYFGNGVVSRHWDHGWLKSAWGAYLECCWEEDQKGPEALDSFLWGKAEQYFNECDSYQRPLVTNEYNNSRQLLDCHVYQGGAWRLHMLRRGMGDVLFWQGVANYLTKYDQKVVETEDFRKELEAVSGMNLTCFFDEWIYGRGYPELKVSLNQPNLVPGS